MPRNLDIVVPVFNEEASIDELYRRVAKLGLADSLIFVDNASTDGTLTRLARYPDVRVIRHATNEGYGASIRHGIAAGESELVIVIDADLEYPPESIPQLVAALQQYPAVYGSRFLEGPPDMPLFRRAGNRIVTAIFNVLFRQRITDLFTGLKGLRRSTFPLHELSRNGFDHIAELSTMIALAGEKIANVPVAYAPRSRGTSKMRHLPETMRFVADIVRTWLRCVVLQRALAPVRGRDI